MFEIMKYGLVRDVTTCGAKIAPAPEMASPVPFAQFGKLHLHSVGRTSFDTAHKVTDGNVGRYSDGCRRELCWNLVWRALRHFESTRSGREVNDLIDGLCCKRLPAIYLAHVDLTGGEQRPEQHCCGIRRWQHSLGFDPPLELFV